MHLTSQPNLWILFTSFNSCLADYVICIYSLLETYRLLGSPGFPGPAAPTMLAIPRPLAGSLVNSSLAGPEPQSSADPLPYFTQEAVSSLPTVLLLHALVHMQENSTLYLTTQMFVAQGGRPGRLRPLTQGHQGQSWAMQGLDTRNGTWGLLKLDSSW